MIKKLLFVFIIAVPGLIATAQQQSPYLQWEKLYGGNNSDEAASVQQTTDYGYIIAGITFSNDRDVSGNHGSYDEWIVKLDAAGNLQWQKALGGSGGDAATKVLQTPDGGYIVAGTTDSNDGDVKTNHGQSDVWIVKLTGEGDIQWKKVYGGSGADAANYIQLTSDTGYIIAGSSATADGNVTSNHGAGDAWIIKLNKLGQIKWQKSYGGSDEDRANSIQQTADGGYIVAGTTLSNDGDVTGNHGSYDYWVLKLNSTGNLQWQRTYGGTGYDYSTSIIQTKGGGYVVAGASTSDDGDVSGHHNGMFAGTDFWIVKLYANGDINWQKSLGGNSDDIPGQVLQANNGSFVVGGWEYDTGGDIHHGHGLTDFWVVDLSSTGTVNWEKAFGQAHFDQASGIAQTADKGFILAGWGGSDEGGKGTESINRGGSDFEVMKLSPEALNTDITISSDSSASNCSAHNSITCKTNHDRDTVWLYRYGVLVAGNITKGGTVTFNDLLPGTYYVTRQNGVIGGTSTPVDLLPVPVSTGTTDITSTSARLNWNHLDCADDYTIKYKVWGATEWTQKKTSGNVNTYNLTGLTPATTYIAKIASGKTKYFVNGTSKFSDSIVFTTAGALTANNSDNINATGPGVKQLIVSPNPAENYFVIHYKNDAQQKVNAILYNENSKAIWNSGLINASSLNNKTVSAATFAKGVYYLKLIDENGRVLGNTKIVIAN